MSELIDTIVQDLPRPFRISKAGLVIFADGPPRSHPRDMGLGPLVAPESRLAEVLRAGQEFLLCADSQAENPIEKELGALREAGYALVMGLKSSAMFLGLLLLGEKKSGAFGAFRGTKLVDLDQNATLLFENSDIFQGRPRAPYILKALAFSSGNRFAAPGRRIISNRAYEKRSPLTVKEIRVRPKGSRISENGEKAQKDCRSPP